MKVSKFVRLEENILLEYVYDSGNLIGEPYNVLYNSKSGIKSFVSGDDSDTNNDLYNQIYEVDSIQRRYAQMPSIGDDRVSGTQSFIQIRNFAASIPVRYDTIKVHIPTNYVFEGHVGFGLRVYTMDFDNKVFIDLSNYFFNIKDIEQNYKIEYSSPGFIFGNQFWGKHFKIDIPASTKISDQRVRNVTKDNSINYNLTDGKGISKNSPVFIDFFFLDSLTLINGNRFFNASHKISTSVSQTPEFENIGVVIEPSSQGDFFLVYGTYNGSIGEFNVFMGESVYQGNRYYVEYQIDLFEKNTKTKSQKVLVTEDFIDEVEYRPIIKWSTTTAVIDVTMRLVDAVDESEVVRKASYGMLQDEVSKYSNNLTKINLSKANKKNVLNIKTTQSPNVGDKAFGTKPILILDKASFNVFSQNYNITDNSGNILFNNQKWTGQGKTQLFIFPFDNLTKFNMVTKDPIFKFAPYNFTQVSNINLTFKSDNAAVDLGIYKDSDENDLENGSVVFRIPEGKYQDIKKISSAGSTSFYINAVDEFNNKIIIYSGTFVPYDSLQNNRKLNDDFQLSQTSNNQIEVPLVNPLDDKIDQVRRIIIDKESIDKGVNTTTADKASLQNGKNKPNSSRVLGKDKSTIDEKPLTDKISESVWNPFWKTEQSIIVLTYGKNNYQHPNDLRALTISLIDSGLLSRIENDADKAINDTKIKYILGYFKGLNIAVDQQMISFFSEEGSSQLMDITLYINSGLTGKRSQKGQGRQESQVERGEIQPKSKRDFEMIKSSVIGNKSNKR